MVTYQHLLSHSAKQKSKTTKHKFIVFCIKKKQVKTMHRKFNFFSETNNLRAFSAKFGNKIVIQYITIFVV